MQTLLKNKLFLFFVISTFLHLVFAFRNLSVFNPRSESKKEDSLRPGVAKTERLKVIFKRDVAINHQVVTTEESQNKTAPKDSKYLSRENQTVDRQTIAKVIDKFNEGGGKGFKKPQVKNSRPAKVKGPNGKFSLADLAHQETPTQRMNNLAAAEIQGIGKNGKGLSSNNDYIEDVPLGDMTLLNTTEFKYYGFYYRIRQQLEQYWGKSLQEKATNMYKSGRRIASDQDKITSLVIFLDPKGNILEVSVKSTSGVKELDDAAIESFNKAGPFPNPPKGMVVNGIVKIEWGFVVKG